MIKVIKKIFIIIILKLDILDKISEIKAFLLFNKTIKNIAAYKDFLATNNFQNSKIFSTKNFIRIPIMDKKNYINKYDIYSRSFKKNFYSAHSLEGSSGYSGKSSFFLRIPKEDLITRNQFELLLNATSDIRNIKTIFINCYAFGIWPSGEKVSRLLKEIAYTRRNKLLVVNPGPDIDLVIEILQVFYKYYNHVILAGYPPFIKSLAEKINEKQLQKKILISVNTGGEGFPEKFRDYIAQKLEINLNKSKIPIIFSSYGVTEFGNGTGSESFLSIQIRRLCQSNKELAKAIFGKYFEADPMLLQYNPINFFVEEVNNEIIATSDSLTPLVRYNIHDIGGVIRYSKMKQILGRFSMNINELVSVHHYDLKLISNLPFIFIVGRSDGTITFRGANLYIENIKKAFLEPEITDMLTGKFKVKKIFDGEMNPNIEISIQLRSENFNTDENIFKVKQVVMNSLLNSNREFRDAVSRVSYDVGIIKFLDEFHTTKIKNVYFDKLN